MTDTASATGQPPAPAAPGEVAPPAAAPVPTPPPAAPAAPAAPPAGEPQTPPAGENDTPWSDPEKAQREIERLRRENGDARINAKKAAADDARKELLATLQAALDPDAAAAGEPVTVEKVTGQLQETSTQLNEARREAAVSREAWQQGLDPARLDYLQFKLARNAEFAALDTAAADFGAKLAAVISTEVTQDPTLKLSGAAVGSGVEQFGGANGASTMTKAEFDRLPYAQRLALYNTNQAEYTRLTSER